MIINCASLFVSLILHPANVRGPRVRFSLEIVRQCQLGFNAVVVTGVLLTLALLLELSELLAHVVVLEVGPRETLMHPLCHLL